MDFYAVLDQVVALLRSRGRVSYRALKRQFALDDELLADLTAELRYAHYPIAEDHDQGLVWTGETAPSSQHTPLPPRPETAHTPHADRPPAEPRAPEAERRQLTVLFCDLVDSTVLASQLDPEEWREVVRAYQGTCAAVIQRYEGHIAQYLGDGLLVYFGYPRAHEDDAQRAVRAGLGMVEAIRQLNTRLAREHWAQVQDGLGQVVLLSGEAGIGKSRLGQVLTEQVATEPQAWLTPCQCSPYYQNTALYPMIELLERVALRFEREESAQQKLHKLEGFLVQYGLPLAETVPLFAALLSLPLGEGYTPLTVSPEQQKQKTLQALLTIVLRIAAQQPVLFVIEDLHWVDPSTLEFLTLLVDQGPTARILALFTCRPDFSPPWSGRSHLTQVTLNRLPRRQAAELTGRVAHGKALPAEVVEQVVAKTDGVPLFVEELTKMVLESGLLQERAERYDLTGPLPPLAIPTTLHDSLMARLDRLAAVKGLAQLGATLGREFSYALLQAVASWDEDALQRGLHQLVAAEFLYQQGLPPQATYRFKHALIQDTAYQSLLRSTRQQYHQRIAQALEAQFPETVETQPELVAQHYTAAGYHEQAVRYWQQAGQQASDRSAHLEAVSHVSTGIELLTTLPETPARTQQALTLWIALGAALIITKGQAAPEVEHAYLQARTLCQQVGEPPELAPVLFGLWWFYVVQPQLHTARELGETLLRLAQRADDPARSVAAHYALGFTWFNLGVLPAAHLHLEAGIACYTSGQYRAPVLRIGHDLGVACQAIAARTLWLLGYPEQALARLHEALALAQALSHPFSLGFARCVAAMVSQSLRDVLAVHEQAEAAIALATEQRFPLCAAWGTTLRGWALAMQDQGEAGMAQVRQGITAFQATGAGLNVPYYYTVLAEVCDHLGHTEDGLQALAEAHTLVEQHEERWWEAEVCRLRGVLLLRQAATPQQEAETWLQRALDIARRQEAKSLELRAAMSLSRLWQQQGKQVEAYGLLAPIYGWFTEGFDTADLQEAKALLEELAG